MVAWTDTEEDVLVEEKVQTDSGRVILIYNDDVNTFEHVIRCLMKYCDHEFEQAEQCAHIIHNNGKCDVKRGTLEKLKPIHEALLENGLSATIEQLK